MISGKQRTAQRKDQCSIHQLTDATIFSATLFVLAKKLCVLVSLTVRTEKCRRLLAGLEELLRFNVLPVNQQELPI